jgi:hypothetical protein
MTGSAKNVFFTCSTTNFDKHRDNYRRIVELIEDSGQNVTSNISLEEFSSDTPIKDASRYSSSNTYFATMKKLAKADMVIADCTVHSMTMGHILSYALSLKKPCLLLAKTKESDPQDLFISGNDSPLLHVKIYDDNKIEKIVRDFLRKAGQDDHVRLNFVLEKEVSNRLDWLSFYTKKSKTEIIRNAINNYDLDLEA